MSMRRDTKERTSEASLDSCQRDEGRRRAGAARKILWSVCVVSLLCVSSVALAHQTRRQPISLQLGAYHGCHEEHSLSDGLDQWIANQKPMALKRILDNIGSTAGAKDGLVIASPSTADTEDEPDYFYTWTRDSALTISTLLPEFLPETYSRPWVPSDRKRRNSTSHIASQWLRHIRSMIPGKSPSSVESLEPLIKAYAQSQAELQMVQTRSGDLWTGGLNEPKYHVNGTRFDGEWGRPQRDGPALRALTLIPYANFLLDRGHPSDLEYIRSVLYKKDQLRAEGSVIKNDLEEVASTWWAEGFDLWEEVDAHHLFTRLASLRALQAGTLLAIRLGDNGAAEWYDQMAHRVHMRLANFWQYEHSSRGKGYWRETIFGRDRAHLANSRPETLQHDALDHALGNQDGSAHTLDSSWTAEVEPIDVGTSDYGRTGLDCAFPLSVIHFGARSNGSQTNDRQLNSFEPSDPEVLATLRRYAKSFEGLYDINGHKKWVDGLAVGRYKEDVYDGVGTESKGNPWFICTFSFAHTLYLAHESFTLKGHVEITHHTEEFWRDIAPDLFADQTLSPPSPLMWSRDSDGKYEDALKRLWEVAERYTDIGRQHVEKERMSEQIDRRTGKMRGARDLTWSYASFIELARARRSAMMASRRVRAQGNDEGQRSVWRVLRYYLAQLGNRLGLSALRPTEHGSWDDEDIASGPQVIEMVA